MYIIACRAHFCHLLGLGHQEPLPGLGEVSHSPRGTSGSARTLDWGPMWLGTQSTCHPNAPLTPPASLVAPNAPWHPYTPTSALYPCWPMSPYTLCQPLNAPLTPCNPCHPSILPLNPHTPDDPDIPDTPTPSRSPPLPPMPPAEAQCTPETHIPPDSPLMPHDTPVSLPAPLPPDVPIPCWPLSPYTPCQPPMHCWHLLYPLMAHWHPLHLLLAPSASWCPL